jgi:hypothetical protein
MYECSAPVSIFLNYLQVCPKEEIKSHSFFFDDSKNSILNTILGGGGAPAERYLSADGKVGTSFDSRARSDVKVRGFF